MTISIFDVYWKYELLIFDICGGDLNAEREISNINRADVLYTVMSAK